MNFFPNRLICRAHNRYSPSIALHRFFFVGSEHLFVHQQRPLSTTTNTNFGEGDGDHDVSSSQDTPSLPRPDAKETHRAERLTIRRLKPHEDTQHLTKAEALVAESLQPKYDLQQASLSAAAKLLATARTAAQDGTDYQGVVVQPLLEGKAFKESGLPWVIPKKERPTTGLERLAAEIDRFYEYSKPDHNEAFARRHIIQLVRQHVRPALPNHILEVFGSERTGLALPTSDIDFRLMLKEKREEAEKPNFPPSPNERFQARKQLSKLQKKIASRYRSYENIRLLFARYPLLALRDRNSGLDIQIVSANDTTLSRQSMVGYMEEYPYLRQLYFVIKTMFDVRGLSDVFAGGFGSYPLFMMIVASIRHKPHPRNDAAGGLINFLKFYSGFDTTSHGISIDPVELFNKSEMAVMTDTVKSKLEAGDTKPLPPFMLCLRDPADETNDLGRKGFAIKHVQATLNQLFTDLNRALQINTRASLLGDIVGPSYLLSKDRRARLRRCGYLYSRKMMADLATTAMKIREQGGTQVADKQNVKEEADEDTLNEHSDKHVLKEEVNKGTGEETNKDTSSEEPLR